MDLIISFLFVSIIGTLFHFTYDYFNHNKVASIFSAVNESTWEHIKMGLSSALLFSIFDGFKYGKIGTVENRPQKYHKKVPMRTGPNGTKFMGAEKC